MDPTHITEEQQYNLTTILLSYNHSEHVYVPATSTPQKKISRRMQTITTSPMMVPTAIPAMAPGDKLGRVMVTGSVAVGEEAQFQYTLPLGIPEAKRRHQVSLPRLCTQSYE